MNSDKLLLLSSTAFRQGKTEEAYNILINNRDSYTKNPTLYYYSLVLACKLNKAKDALHFLSEAVIKLGMWYSTDFLDSDPGLKLIIDSDEYKSIYNICKQRQTDLRFSGEKKIDIYVPEISTSKLFFMLPGNFQSINSLKEIINQNTIKNHIIAIPQSREFHTYSKHIWSDTQFGVKVILEHYNEIIKEYNIDESAVIVSSFAAGGNVVFRALVDRAIPVNKVIFFSPSITDLESFEPEIKSLKERNIKFFIVCGEKDSHYLPFSDQLDSILTKYSINHKYLKLSDLGHTLPENAKEIIEQANIYFNS